MADHINQLVTEFAYCVTDEKNARPWTPELADKTEAARKRIVDAACKLSDQGSHRWPAPLKHRDDAETPEQAWKFWKPLVTNEDGSLNEEAVRNELSDFSMLMRYYSEILCAVSGQRISIQTTHPSAVVAEFEDYLSERIEEAVKDETEPLLDLLREAREYLADTDPDSEFLRGVDAALSKASS